MTPAEQAIARWLRHGRAFAEQAASGVPARLTPLENFGSNPGALGAWRYVPDGLAPGAALVVVLHGCTQTAAGYDRGSGWSMLAERHGFALLYPEQQPTNNANLCFNWFQPQDIRRDSGEVASIRQMIAAMVTAHGIDRRRIYITGLSAGGAMTAAMIATYPETFAGAAIIAGLPYGCAKSLPEAIERMAGRNYPPAALLTRLVTAASDHRGPWPMLSVWQGDADRVVAPMVADRLLEQWRGLLGLAAAPDVVETVAGHPHRVWRGAADRTLIESYTILGMDHGVPLDPGGPEGCGMIGPFMLAAGISSTAVIARSWGLIGRGPVRSPGRTHKPSRGFGGVGGLIEQALRSIGVR